MKFEPTESDYNEYVELVTPTSSVPRKLPVGVSCGRRDLYDRAGDI